VLVDAGAAERLLSLDLADRSGVVLLADEVDRLEVWRAAARLGAREVLATGRDEQALLDLLATAGDPVDGPPGTVVGVLPGSGGAGASTLAVAVAIRAAGTDGAVTLVDADAAGGGLELLLGAERVGGLRWPDLADVRGVVASRALDEALPHVAGLRLLSHLSDATAAVPAEAMTAVLTAARRRASLVVVDLPRAPFDAAAAAALELCDVVVVVALAEVRAVAAAGLAVKAATSRSADVRLAVRPPARSRLRPVEVGTALGLPVVATVPHVGDLSAAADRGDLPRVLARSAVGRVTEHLLADLVPAAADRR
jgi:secretion/DNA translocation related CpaE-like protein